MQSTDPKDRIYAALGFLELDKSKAGKIVPNYSEECSTGQVFAGFTETILAEIPGLEILALREDSERSTKWPDLPSWAPDFTAPKGLLLVQEENSYCKEPPDCKVSGGMLWLEGFFTDEIASVMSWETGDKTFAPGAKVLDTLRIWLSAVSHLIHESPYSEDPLEVLWRTLIANKTSEPNLPEIDSSHFRSFMAQTAIDTVDGIFEESGGETIVSPSIIAEPFPASDSKPCPSWLDDLQAIKARVKTSLYPKEEDVEGLEALYKKAGIFMARWLRFAVNRRLYVTLNGYVGLGPVSMRVADRITVINGSELLFLVRDKDAVHELVGETYVHGLSGEYSWDRRNAQKIELASILGYFNDIVLC